MVFLSPSETWVNIRIKLLAFIPSSLVVDLQTTSVCSGVSVLITCRDSSLFSVDFEGSSGYYRSSKIQGSGLYPRVRVEQNSKHNTSSEGTLPEREVSC